MTEAEVCDVLGIDTATLRLLVRYGILRVPAVTQ